MMKKILARLRRSLELPKRPRSVELPPGRYLFADGKVKADPEWRPVDELFE